MYILKKKKKKKKKKYVYSIALHMQSGQLQFIMGLEVKLEFYRDVKLKT